MKRAAFVVIAALVFSTLAWSQPPAAPATNSAPTFSEQDRAAAKKELEKIGEMFGVAKQQESPKTPDKAATIAEVADKALDMVGNAVGTIAGIVQKVAPEVWEIMVRQQYATAIGMLIGPTLFLSIVCAYTLITKRYWKKGADYDKESYYANDFLTNKGFRGLLTTLLPGAMALVFTSVLAYKIGDAVPMLINPKYYAVRDLLQMLLK